MKILFIAKPLSGKGNGVVSALKNEILHLQKIAEVALYNIGVELDKDIAENIFTSAKFPDISSLPFPYNKPDIIVFEEVYKLEYIKLYKECLKINVPYVIIPHGCLVSMEQNRKKLKHIIANILLFNRFIGKAVAVQYLNKQEQQSSEFKSQKNIIIPNSIEPGQIISQPNYNPFNFIYIGRYDIEIKGLDLLIDTFITLKDWCLKHNVVLNLYGPENTENTNILNSKIQESDCCKTIKINGPVYAEEKFRKLQEAAAFIQTSRNEGQPMSIMEALSFGVPCIVTYATSFGEYCNENNCGIGVNFSKDELTNAIKEIYNNKTYREICKQNAFLCARRDFDIKKVATHTLEMYKSLIK